MVDAKFDEHGNKLVNEAGDLVGAKCPSCGEGIINRSRQSRSQSKEYVCDKCGFVGP